MLTAKIGKIHDYISVKFDLKSKGKLIMFIAEYVQSVLNDFSLSIQEKSETPDFLHLHKINPIPILIYGERNVIFHANVAQLSWLT